MDHVKGPVQRIVHDSVDHVRACPKTLFALMAQRVDVDVMPEQRAVDAKFFCWREGELNPDAEGSPEVIRRVLRILLSEELDCGVLSA